MTLVPTALVPADTSLLPPVSPVVAAAPPVPPAFLASLEALVAQVVDGPDPVRPALELSRLTVTRMAEELGIPRATLAAYRLGTRRMPAAGRVRLGEYLAAHAEALARVARVLSGKAEM